MNHAANQARSAPELPHVATRTTEETLIHATDGYALAATIYFPRIPTSDVVLINSGTGVKRSFYRSFALFLTSYGFTVITYDYRGIGDSLRGRMRHFDTSMSEWGSRDVAGAIAWAFERFGERTNLSIVGHSAGGKIVGFAPNNDRITALVTVSVPNSYWGLHRAWLRLPYALFVHSVMPTISHALAYFPAKRLGIGENYPKSVALQWSRWSRYKGYIRDENIPTRYNYPTGSFGTFAGAVLAYSFDDDWVATPEAVVSLMKFYNNAASHTHRHIARVNRHALGIPRIGHSGFFRTAAQPLWSNLAAWLRERHDEQAKQ